MSLTSPKSRRRGAALEEAILEAASEQLKEGGYTRFTIEAVAERAGTSRPVLYRRWPTRADLLLATIRWYGDRTRPPTPDTGSLREDVLTLLRFTNGSRLSAMAVIGAQIGSFYEETGVTPAELRRHLIGDRPQVLEAVIDQAVARGEAPAGLPRRIRELPFDLLRSEAMLTMAPVPDEHILEIVDDVFLPLIGLRLAGGAAARVPGAAHG